MKKIVLAALFFIPFGNVFAQQKNIFRDEAYHYTITLPEGWNRIPSNIIEEAARIGDRLTGKRTTRYSAGIQYGTHYFSYDPYILINYHDAKLTWDEFKEDIMSMNPSAVDLKHLQDLMSIPEISSSFADHEKKLIIIKLKMDIVVFGEKQGLLVMFLGKECIVQFNINVMKDDYSKYLDDFIDIIYSFEYDAGFEYR
jgi:hypothetical protein